MKFKTYHNMKQNIVWCFTYECYFWMAGNLKLTRFLNVSTLDIQLLIKWINFWLLLRFMLILWTFARKVNLETFFLFWGPFIWKKDLVDISAWRMWYNLQAWASNHVCFGTPQGYLSSISYKLYLSENRYSQSLTT